MQINHSYENNTKIWILLFASKGSIKQNTWFGKTIDLPKEVDELQSLNVWSVEN